jgi:hypothetical protein
VRAPVRPVEVGPAGLDLGLLVNPGSQRPERVDERMAEIERLVQMTA